MSSFDDPFRSDRPLHRGGRSCGAHASQDDHDLATSDQRFARVVEGAVMRALFPRDVQRGSFLRAVGASTALAAIAQFFPLSAATEAFAQGTGAVEKKNLKEVKKLIDLGKEKGYLTYDDVNDMLPAEVVSPDQIDDVALLADEYYGKMGKDIPRKRAGEAQEVANVIAFLASDAASYVTGTSINLDGGISGVL